MKLNEYALTIAGDKTVIKSEMELPSEQLAIFKKACDVYLEEKMELEAKLEINKAHMKEMAEQFGLKSISTPYYTGSYVPAKEETETSERVLNVPKMFYLLTEEFGVDPDTLYTEQPKKGKKRNAYFSIKEK